MINVGIIAAGNIARTMAKTANYLETTHAYAIASRTLPKAQAFASEHNVEVAYGSYEELIQDPKVDLVYIATPHSHHYKYAKMALLAGKHTVCEKAFTVNARQAKELVSISKEKNLFLAEAVWTRYLPAGNIIKDIIVGGEIGEKVSIMADFGLDLRHLERFTNPNLAGGALLDLGIYPLTAMRMFFPEEIEEIVSHCVKYNDTVDAIDNISIKMAGGKMAFLQCNFLAQLPGRVTISGTKGYIEYKSVTNPRDIHVVNRSAKIDKIYDVPEQVTGFEYELTAFVNAIENGKIECEEMPHKEIIAFMEIMDTLRKQWDYEIPDID